MPHMTRYATIAPFSGLSHHPNSGANSKKNQRQPKSAVRCKCGCPKRVPLLNSILTAMIWAKPP